MGLDIYLSDKAHGEQLKSYYAALDKFYEQYPGEGEGENYKRGYTDEQYAAFKAKHPEPENRWSDEAKARDASVTDPEHYCNKRYLRSSYNDGGFNSATVKFLSKDQLIKLGFEPSFYGIFEPLGVEGPDGLENDGRLTEQHLLALEECKARALMVENELAKSDGLSLMRIEQNPFISTPDIIGDAAALDWYRKLVAEDRIGDDGWSNREGDVFGKDGVKVLAAVPSVYASFTDSNHPCTYLIYKADPESVVWYQKAAAIAAEFCQEAIDLIKRDGACYLDWSG